MNYNTLINFFAASLTVLMVSNDTFAVGADLAIQEVTVHQGTAQILRVGKVQLAPGTNRVQIQNLPVSLLEESLMAGTDSNLAEVTGTRTWKEEGTAASNPEVALLQRKIVTLQKELETVVAKENDLKSEKGLLTELRNKVSDTISRNLLYGKVESDGKNWGTYLRKNREESFVLFSSWEKIERSKIKIQSELDEVKAQLSVLLSQAEKSTRNTWIQIVNTSKESKTIDLRLSYLVPNANWKPTYILTANDSSEKAQFEYLSEVRQETGEDWKGVRLLLSTTRPDLSQRRNRLYPQRLFDQEVADKKEVLSAQSQASTPAQMAEGLVDEESGRTSPTTSERGGGFLFRLPKTVSLPSQRESRKLEMSSFNIPIKVRTIASPRYKPFPLLEATFQNPSEFPILPGEVSLFRNSGLIGTTKISYTSPGENVSVSLGTEGSLRLSYRKESNNTKEGLISTQKVIEKRVYLTLENFGKESKSVFVRDQVPISELASVKVEIDSDRTTPGAKEFRPNSGIYEWVLEIPPSGKREIQLEYRVSYPSDQDLNLP
ncbi:hypothetical protein LEP1GSC047_1284 [Leptospira inadai serovar Lyme str. 10]|uniref:Mucoidy inhibitor MuiA family protein n=2 Tax=Leptospira inadai serovar Lyme TaxID=293084 RepID=V6H8F8_9LEPT|nr:mucoidy inhibitor MuiA family protein [Leptospira inadai]EQA35002.1 hypothetical protein LEP1GSC047_1284 [Leptospira inadai serovar Lyme str. 10]PNV76015.1 hypothetical protein BES34_005795 [Leptospira inadai serovar Lyme]